MPELLESPLRRIAQPLLVRMKYQAGKILHQRAGVDSSVGFEEALDRTFSAQCRLIVANHLGAIIREEDGDDIFRSQFKSR